MSQSYVPAALRQRVAARASHRCGYCLTAVSIIGMPMEIDHIVPEAHGGTTVEENLWLACTMCNLYKGDQTTAKNRSAEKSSRCSIRMPRIGASISPGGMLGLRSSD